MRRPIVAGAGVLGALLATTTHVADACGDKLVALGGGVSFKRIVSAPHGDILLYVSAGSQLQTADMKLGLRSALERAGHRVRAVHDREALAAELTSRKPDLVLMDWTAASDRQLSDGTGGVAVLGVRFDEIPHHSGAEATNVGCVVDARKHKGRRLLSTVAEILRSQSKGLAPPCNKIT